MLFCTRTILSLHQGLYFLSATGSSTRLINSESPLDFYRPSSLFPDFHKTWGSFHIFQYTLPATSEFSLPRNPICLHVPLSLGCSYRSQQSSFAFCVRTAMATGRASDLTPFSRKMGRLRSKWTGNSTAQMCVFQPLNCVRPEMSYLAGTAQEDSVLLVIYAYRNSNWKWAKYLEANPKFKHEC